MKTQRTQFTNPKNKGIGFASLLIIAGILLLSAKLQIISAEYTFVILSWQMLLIALGARALFRKHYYGAVALLSIGIFFIIPKIAAVPHSFIQGIPGNYIQVYWPILLIIAGVTFLVKRRYPNQHSFKFVEEQFTGKHSFNSNNWSCENGSIYKNSAFEAGEHIVLDPEFKGGEITLAFGETRLDLRKTNLPEGETNLELKVTFGSVVVIVPEGWNVHMKVNNVFGTFEDKRSSRISEANQSKTLVIYGNIAFGSGEIRD